MRCWRPSILGDASCRNGRSGAGEGLPPGGCARDGDRAAGRRSTEAGSGSPRVPSTVHGKEIPLFLADYVLMGYGTGPSWPYRRRPARLDFAKQHGSRSSHLKRPREWPETQAYTGDGVKINSASSTDSPSRRRSVRPSTGCGQRHRAVEGLLSSPRLGDQPPALLGAPIPILYCETCGMVAEREDRLPVVLPEDVQISGKGAHAR